VHRSITYQLFPAAVLLQLLLVMLGVLVMV